MLVNKFGESSSKEESAYASFFLIWCGLILSTKSCLPPFFKVILPFSGLITSISTSVSTIVNAPNPGSFGLVLPNPIGATSSIFIIAGVTPPIISISSSFL